MVRDLISVNFVDIAMGSIAPPCLVCLLTEFVPLGGKNWVHQDAAKPDGNQDQQTNRVNLKDTMDASEAAKYGTVFK